MQYKCLSFLVFQPRKRFDFHAILLGVLAILSVGFNGSNACGQSFRAGAYAKRIDPVTLPVWVNGGIAGQQTDRVRDSLFARCLVLESQGQKIAICIVDNCILPHEITDAAKVLVKQRIGLAPEQVLIAATHTHSAVSVTGVHGCPVQEDYAAQLPNWIADGIVKANERLRPAQFGTASVVAEKYIYCRDWLMKPGTANSTRFSGRSSNDVSMNPGHDNPNKIAPVGPVDRNIPILSIQDHDGKSIALLASFSTHYAGAGALSSDYFGVVADRLAKTLRPEAPDEFVGIMANATSGNANCIDFGKPREPFTYGEVGNYVSEKILSSLSTIQYSRETNLDSAFDAFDVKVRMPPAADVQEAKAWIKANLGDRLPKTMDENYARETVLLSELPSTRRMNLQVFRLGGLAIVGNPCESYCETGLKIRQSSPFELTMNIGLANGHCGYIPPPEMFQLGGYTTWRCRTSCLEEQAEPIMVAGLTKLLNSLHDRSKQKPISRAPNPKPPVSPEDSLNHLELEEGFAVELVASEPQVVDPVSMQIDERGRIWVVEMRDYPSGVEQPLSRIVVLEDRDSDGKMETSHTFADGLRFATGLQLWKDGVIVTVEGQLLFLRDRDGNLHADTTETWLTGFSTTNSQLRANHPTLTPDGWLTIASGLRGGKIAGDPSSGIGQSIVDITGSDVRLHLIGKQLESIAGPSQFGLAFDSMGRRYGCSNRQPCFEIVADREDVNLSPLAGFAPSIQNTLPAEGESRVYPLVNAWTTSTLHAGQFTAACGVCVTHSPQFGSVDQTTVLACEPTGGLVQRKSLDRTTGIGRDASKADASRREWLASRDPWFRPVDLYEGPEGSIYVVDMYRAVIEHPEWVPKELQDRPDQRYGDSHGRIYRVTKRNTAKREVPAIRDLPQALEKLSSSDAWLQRQASRLVLQEISDHGISPITEKQLRSALHDACRRSDPSTAHTSAGILQSAGKLNASDINELLRCHRREVRLTGLHFGKQVIDTIPPEALEKIVDLSFSLLTSEDREESRRTAWLLSRLPAGYRFTDTQVKTASKLMSLKSQDRYLWMSVSAMFRNQMVDFLTSYLDQVLADTSAFSNGFATETVTPHDVESEAIERLGSWLIQHKFEGGNDSKSRVELLKSVSLMRVSDVRARNVCLGLLLGFSKSSDIGPLKDPSFQELLRSFTKADFPLSDRMKSIRLLGIIGDLHAEFLMQFLEDKDNDIVKETIAALAKHPNTQYDAWLVKNFSTVPPSVRASIFQAIRRNPERLVRLLDAIEANQISVRLLDAGQLKSLQSIDSTELKQRVKRIVSSLSNPNRAKVIEQYAEKMRGREVGKDPNVGKALFQKNCAGCHQLDGIGYPVGPNISDSRTFTYEKLLVAILDPNQAIDANYFRYKALTEDGETVEGLLRDSNAQSITLELQNGVKRTLNRSELSEFISSGISMMPEGLESQLSYDDMAELLWYVKNWRYVADNVPAVAKLP